jgi:hypothetical protein
MLKVSNGTFLFKINRVYLLATQRAGYIMVTCIRESCALAALSRFVIFYCHQQANVGIIHAKMKRRHPHESSTVHHTSSSSWLISLLKNCFRNKLTGNFASGMGRNGEENVNVYFNRLFQNKIIKSVNSVALVTRFLENMVTCSVSVSSSVV